MTDSRHMEIRIKTGVVNRLVKEKLMYKSELEKEKEILWKMQASGEDSYSIQKQEEEIKVSEMIIYTVKSYQVAYRELQKMLCNMADYESERIKMKTGVVNRLAKEMLMYQREVEKEKERLRKMQASDEDGYLIRKQHEVIMESEMMIPYTVKRYQVAYRELQKMLGDMADPRIKQIRIKTGVVKRLAKEKLMYEKEAEKEREKLGKMQASGEDSYLIRKQEEVIKESQMMVPDTVKRYQVAYNELQEILENDSELSENEVYQAAVETLKETSKALAIAE